MRRTVASNRASAGSMNPDVPMGGNPATGPSRAEGLGHEVVRADCGAPHPVPWRAPRGEERDGKPVGRAGEPPDRLEAVEVGKHHVEEHEVGAERLDLP